MLHTIFRDTRDLIFNISKFFFASTYFLSNHNYGLKLQQTKRSPSKYILNLKALTELIIKISLRGKLAFDSENVYRINIQRMNRPTDKCTEMTDLIIIIEE